jgi:peroxiredoxin
VNLSERCRHRLVVVFAYPRTGRPGVEPLVPDWDQIPGARGCTPEACGFRDLTIEFTKAGAELFGLSTQDTEYQNEAVARLGLEYPLLSDDRLVFTGALKLPTMTVAGTVLLRRCTLILAHGRVRDVLYPVFPPDAAAAEALRVLRGGNS